jgi:hypothetical protein
VFAALDLFRISGFGFRIWKTGSRWYCSVTPPTQFSPSSVLTFGFKTLNNARAGRQFSLLQNQLARL